MTQSLYEGFGGLDLPIPAASTLRTFADTDPARAVLAGLFRAAITAELTDRWNVVRTGTPLASKAPVEDVFELAPFGGRLKQRKTEFPLLCVYRDGPGISEEHTLGGIERLTQPWCVDYILGPLELGDARKLIDVFQTVVKVVKLCIRKRGHPAYESGALQFFPGKGHIGAIRMVRYDGPPAYQARFIEGDDTVYYAVSMVLETVEYTRDYDDAFGDAESMTLQANVASEQEGPFPFYGDSRQEPEDATVYAADVAEGTPTEFMSVDGSGFIETESDFIAYAEI